MREFKERKKPSQSSEAFFKPTVQTKLSVGQTGDKYEQEADAMAEKIVNGSSESTKNTTGEKQKAEKTGIPKEAEKVLPDEVKNAVQSKEDASELVQKKEDEEQQKIQQKEEDKETIQSKEEDSATADEEQKIQKKEEESDVIQPKEEEQDMSQIQAKANEMQKTMGENTSTSPEQASLENRLKQRKGQGSPLNKDVKAEMENGFGSDFSDVRIHTDKEAQQMTSEMGAQAFTYGSDIYFNSGKYNPKSNEGKLLLAHELSHVLQQRRAPQLNLVQRHTVEDCNNEYYNVLIPACNRLKNKAKRAICFEAAAATYAACLASADEVMAGVLLTAAIIAAAILILADGPLPFGDAAAAAILLSVGIKL